jgi:hypothetical protein
MRTSNMEHQNIYKKSSRKDAKIAKDAKLLFVNLSLYFQDFYYFKYNISCKTRIYRIKTLRLCALARGIFVFGFFFFLLASCTSMIQKGGEVLEGSAFAAKPTALYSSDGIELKEIRSKDGESFIEITNSQWPGLALRGNTPDTDGSFQLTEARILSTHVSGWNELNYELLGSGNFSAGLETGEILRIDEAPERVQISSGKIRLKSRRLTGNTALVALRNRRERILSLTEWMGEWQEKSGNSTYFENQKEFDEYWKSLLFPELISEKKRPQNYSAIYANTESAEWNRADGVKWNLAYTKSIFPEALWEFRNSGALLRDWEEALPWIFMEYSWETIISTFNNKTLQKK